MSAEQACRLLGVKRSTLYAYASRRLVRSSPVSGSRQRHYSREDVERLKARHDARSGHGPVAAAALRWGEPVLDSSITGITMHGPIYRGHDANRLASDHVPFESVAELLWSGVLPSRRPKWTAAGFGVNPAVLMQLIPKRARPFDALQIAFGAISNTDVASVLIRRAVASFGLVRGARAAKNSLRQTTVARSFLVALGGKTGSREVAAIERALVLVADHELNPSSFAARLPASVGANLRASMAAAIATLAGPAHGGASDRAEALLDETRSAERAPAVVRDHLRRGNDVPGFGHPLYPAGDPRAIMLLAVAEDLGRNDERVRTARALSDAMALADGPKATLDLGLVALTSALQLPPGSAIALFAAGRMAGWVAHALEQRAAGYSLRPRARYVGAQPRS